MTIETLEEKVRQNMHPLKYKGYWYDIGPDGKLWRIKDEDIGRTWLKPDGEIATGWERTK